jgi:TPR repeat protein
MVGYMNMTGKGVEKDYIAGLTWYRLAAERGDKNFSKARDEVWAAFNDEQRRQSNRMYGELRWQFSDAMIVAKLVEQDLAIVEQRVPENSLSLSADEDSVLTADQEELADTAKKRVEARLKYLRAALISTREMSVAETERIQELLARAETILN